MGLRDDLDGTPVSELNVRTPVTIHRSATVRDGVEAMRTGKLGCVIVLNDDGQAAGIFTEGMLRHRLNESPAVLHQPLVDHMVERFPWVLPTDSASMILDAMEEHNTRFIVVRDKDGGIAGLVGQKTLMEFVANCLPRIVLTEDPTGTMTSSRREGA